MHKLFSTSLSIFLLFFSLTLSAQSMSDDQILKYIIKEHNAGTSQAQIVSNLIKQGVDINQIRRVRKKYEKEIQEQEAQAQRLQAQYAYDRLSKEGKQLLSEIVRIGEKSSYSDVYIIRGKYEHFSLKSQLDDLCYSDNVITSWISVDDGQDSYCVYIKSPLNLILEESLNKE